MAAVSRSSRLFLQRCGLTRTQRTPEPVAVFQALNIRDYPLKSPAPPHLLVPTQGDPVPDRGVSGEWPSPSTEGDSDGE